MTFARLLLVIRMRLRALFQRERLDAELDEELQDHLLRQIEANVRSGMHPTEARRAALLAMGGVQRRKEESRDVRGVAMFEALQQDLRYAWRGLRSKPGFTTAVVLALGLGLGANAAMFGIIDRLMFRPPAFLRAPERVHRVYVGWTLDGYDQIDPNISYKRFAELTQWSTAFERSTAVAYRTLAVRIGQDVSEMTAAAVSADFFGFFDARPALGRFFSVDEDRAPTGSPVLVLGYDLWQSRYEGDPNVLGKQLDVRNTTYTIVGVAPKGLVGITDGPAPAVFIPVTAFGYEQNKDYYRNHGWTWLEMFVRRKPKVTPQAASADLTSAFRRSWLVEHESSGLPSLKTAQPRAMAGNVLLSRGPKASPESKIATLTTGVAVVVLLIACANVTNLLLARAIGRRREVALRLALGVTRGRLLQQLLTESVLLAAMGGLVGIAAAQWGGRALRVLLLQADDANAVFTDTRTLLFVGALALSVAVITGLFPAMLALRDHPASALKAGLREGAYRRSRTRTGLLLFQATLSTVLLVGAALFVRSLQNVRAMPLGYDAESVVYAHASMRGAPRSDGEQNAFNERLVNAATTVPGVRSASLTVSVPFEFDAGRGAPFVPGVDSVRKLGSFTSQAGSPWYFATIGTHILRGRGITIDDRPGTPRVLVISQSMAKALWPGDEAVGKQIRIGSDTTPFSTVVGVAEDIRGRDLKGGSEFWYYMPLAQYIAFYGKAEPSLFVRVEGRAEDYVEGLRRRLQREVSGAAYVRTQSLADMVAARRRPWEIGATMLVAFGALALVLAAIGLYSVISYGVAQRTHELGVRMALGASSGDVVRLVVGQGVGFAVGGIAIGSAIGLWAGKWVEPMLFSQSAHDPRVFAFVGILLLAVAISATLGPAVRATRVDPTVALRID
jgi:putative ABC transport system permease protein